MTEQNKQTSAPQETFLQRQRRLEAEKQQRMEKRIADSQVGLFQPKVGKRSVKLAESLRSGRTPRRTSRKTYETIEERESSFTPKINPSASLRAARPLHELSAGDFESRAARREAKRQELIEAEISGLTFKPKTNTERNRNVNAKVSVLRDPKAYMESLKERERRRQQRADERELELRDKEMSECSFASKTTKPPKYIKPERVEAARLGGQKATGYSTENYPQWNCSTSCV